MERDDCKDYLKNIYGINDIESLQMKKAVELGHIFKLGDKYSKAMNATFMAENGKTEHFVMGCYGIGVSRTLAMIYENSILKNDKNDFDGISLPINIAPYSLYIIPKSDDDAKTAKAKEVYELLLQNNVQVLFDDRDEQSIGAKLKDCKITGIPYVAVFGKTLDQGFVAVENIKTGEKMNLDMEKFVSTFVEFEKCRKYNRPLENILGK